jgi:hypothetical protein
MRERRIHKMRTEQAAAEIKSLMAEALLVPRPWSAMPLDSMMADAGRAFFETQKKGLRLSYGADCDRQRWYEDHEPEKASLIDGQTRLKFSFGYCFERLLLSSLGGYLEMIQGPWMLDAEWAQKEITLDVGGRKIPGHPDGLLLYQGKPAFIMDPKMTTASMWKGWEEGRMPDAMWGYRHQAANYLRAAEAIIRARLKGMLWLVGVVAAYKPTQLESVEVGWMTEEELRPWGARADAGYRAGMGSRIPLPVNQMRDATPCCGKGGKPSYCGFHDHCRKDQR